MCESVGGPIHTDHPNTAELLHTAAIPVVTACHQTHTNTVKITKQTKDNLHQHMHISTFNYHPPRTDADFLVPLLTPFHDEPVLSNENTMYEKSLLLYFP